MTKTVVSGAVLVAVALLTAAGGWRLGRSSKSSWRRSEERLALVGALLVVPAAVVAAIVNGTSAGIGGFILWGALGAIAYGTARYDTRMYRDPEAETRWLLDVDVLVLALVTVFFGILDFGMVYVPATVACVLSCRVAHLRHTEPLFPWSKGRAEKGRAAPG